LIGKKASGSYYKIAYCKYIPVVKGFLRINNEKYLWVYEDIIA